MSDPRQFKVGDVIQLEELRITIDRIDTDGDYLHFYGPEQNGEREAISYDTRLPVELNRIELVG